MFQDSDAMVFPLGPALVQGGGQSGLIFRNA
jgi:hypothetical protein